MKTAEKDNIHHIGIRSAAGFTIGARCVIYLPASTRAALFSLFRWVRHRYASRFRAGGVFVCRQLSVIRGASP